MIEILAGSTIWLQLVARVGVLTYIGLAFLLLFKSGFVNLGISAQLIASGLIITYVIEFTGSIFVSLLCSFIAAAFVGALPVHLRFRYGVSEVLSTLFLSYMAPPLALFFMSKTTQSLTVGSPTISSFVVPDTWLIYDNITLIHLLSPAALLLCAFLWSTTIFGYKARALADNNRTLSARDSEHTCLVISAMCSALLVLVVFADVVIVKRRYVAGDYDTIGFLGVAVGLISLRRIPWVIAGSLFVAATETLFLLLSVEHKLPQSGSFVLYGVGILLAAWLTRDRNDASRTH